MNKPEYVEGFFKIAFLWLGIGFVFMGLLCFAGVLKPKASSMIQDPILLGMFFSSIGMILLIVQIILKVMIASKDKLHNKLAAGGTRRTGTVGKVCLQRYTKYGNKYPYRIFYTYTCQGKVYHHKSNLLWDKPCLKEGDSIVVYTNDSGKSTIAASFWSDDINKLSFGTKFR